MSDAGIALSGSTCAIVRVFDQLPQVKRQAARGEAAWKKSPQNSLRYKAYGPQNTLTITVACSFCDSSFSFRSRSG